MYIWLLSVCISASSISNINMGNSMKDHIGYKFTEFGNRITGDTVTIQIDVCDSYISKSWKVIITI